MSAEEQLLEALEEDEEEDEAVGPPVWREKQRRRLQQKNRTDINQFLGKSRRTNHVGILPRYYAELLTWALHRYLEREGWKITATLGYHGPEPVYVDVDTGGETENLLMDGQMLIEKGDIRYTVTVDANPRRRGSVQLEGPLKKKKEMAGFIGGILDIVDKENFYQGKKIEFSGRIRFLDIKDRSWDSIVLESEVKHEINANTVDFLRRNDEWSKYGIPLKRGILLAGEPGTGKTIICKALMAEADGITCVTTNGYALDDDDYITELYELAEDLSPCIVFIEDIDLIGQSRMEFGYQRGSALLSLLSVMDGVEEQQEVVTIATTNCLETLDKALSERPSRFDRVIKLSRPSIEQRIELISRLCEKIPLDDDIQEYIAGKTENCTPAQLQEIIYSLVIQYSAAQSELLVNKADVDRAISRINNKNRHRLGFTDGNHNGDKLNLAATIKLG
ncbi:AAA family ATPase [Chloroflexota bacterium]